MILDSLLQFDSGYTMLSGSTGAVGAHDSTNIVDFGLGSSTNPAIPSDANGGGARDMGVGDNPALKLLVQVNTTLTSGGAATLAIALAGAPDDGTGAPGSWTPWWSSPTYALATLAAGARLLDMDFPRPPAGIAVPRFVKLIYTVGAQAFTGGVIQSYIVIDRDDQMYNSTNNAVQGGYRAGITVAN